MIPREPLPAGTPISDKWIIGKRLGEGGMGSVYAAVHQRTAARVAIKILHEEQARDPDIVARFLSEGRAANLVAHPGAVAVLDDGVTPAGVPYLVMELLEGESVEALAERNGGALSLGVVARIGAGALEVIAAAHARGIVHRDLKPENLFMLKDGSIKVLDFGLARLWQAPSLARLTQAGVPMGTPAFMPPEQALARWDQVDARSDVYSLGASLFTLLTNRLVHEGSTVPEIVVLTTTRQASPVRTFAPGLPPALAQVIDRALAYWQDDRWPDAGVMLEAWRAALHGGVEDVRVSRAFEEATTQTAGRATRLKIELRNTTAPVSTMHTVDRRRARAIGIGLALSSLIIVACVFMLARLWQAAEGGAAAREAPSAGETSTALPEPPVAASATSEPTAEPPVISPQPSEIGSSSARPLSRGSRPNPEPTSTFGGTRSSVTTTATPSAVAGCDPPFVIDARGVKQFKAQCLQ